MPCRSTSAASKRLLPERGAESGPLLFTTARSPRNYESLTFSRALSFYRWVGRVGLRRGLQISLFGCVFMVRIHARRPLDAKCLNQLLLLLNLETSDGGGNKA